MSAEAYLALMAGLLGAMLGSFLNVCILRWPRNESVVRPRSRCPGCGRLIAWYDNIPVLSWLLLRGRCRHCKTGISIQYPLIELTTALLWAWMFWRLGPTVLAVRAAVFATILLGIAMTDAREYIIPHEFTLGGIALGVGLLFLARPAPLWLALFGACFGAGLLYFVGLLGRMVLGREAMGGGDVAMLALVGCYLGWEAVLATVFLGSVVGLVLELGLRALRRRRAPPVPAGDPEPAPLPPEPSPATRGRDRLLLAAVVLVLIPASLLGQGSVWTAVGGMLAGLGLAFLCFTLCSVVLTPVPLVERWYHAGYALAGCLLPLAGAAGWEFGTGALVVGSLLIAGTVALHFTERGIQGSASPPPADPLETMTTAELRQLQYLPFGVSLAIAAALVAFVLGPERVNAWLSIYR